MRYAFRFTSTFGKPLIDAAGRPGGEDSGGSLLRRLMRLVPDPLLIVSDPDVECPPRDDWWFDVVTLRELDVNDTVVVNMDVVDSPELYRQLRRGTWRRQPRLVNFVWWNVSEWTDPVERRLLAVSCGSFPTFCNSDRTETEVRELVRAELSPSRGHVLRLAWCNLGVADTGVEHDPAAPLEVVYPAMWLFARKRPARFADIVAPVAARAGARVRVRLREAELRHPIAVQWERQPGWDVAGLVPWERHLAEMARSTVFVATAEDESYGLQYAELMMAGVVGIFPDRPWADTLVPVSYPLRYSTVVEARQLLAAVLDAPDVARSINDTVRAELRRDHRPETFDGLFQKMLVEWSEPCED